MIRETLRARRASALVLGLSLALGTGLAAYAAPPPIAAQKATRQPGVAAKKKAVVKRVVAVRGGRVAGGQIVPIAMSAFTSRELAAMRPHYQDLKPKVRSNQGD